MIAVEIGVKCLARFLRDEHTARHFPALASDVDEVLTLILVEINPKKLRYAQAGPEQHEEDGSIPHRLLVAPLAKVDELFSRGLETRHLDVFQTLPFGIIDTHLLDALGWVAGKERPPPVDPLGAVAERSQYAVDRRWTSLLRFKPFQEIRRDRTCSEIDLDATGRLVEELNE